MEHWALNEYISDYELKYLSVGAELRENPKSKLVFARK